MRKLLCFVLTLFVVLSFTACGSEQNGNANKKTTTKTVNDILNEKTEGNDSKSETSSVSSTSEVTSKTNTVVSDKKVEIDLSKLSSSLAYSEVCNILNSPSDYYGKIIKMKSTFSVYTDEKTGKNYFACMFGDATACCQTAIEFVLAGDYEYPKDYPSLGSEITVMGEFQSYSEGENTYYYLINASLCE